MVEVGVISGVTGSLWKLFIVFLKLTIVFVMFNMTWHRYIVQLLTTEETLVNQDWVRYSTNELKFIRSKCQKIFRVKYYSISNSTMYPGVWGIQRRRKRGRRGGVIKETIKNSNYNENNLITLDTTYTTHAI